MALWCARKRDATHVGRDGRWTLGKANEETWLVVADAGRTRIFRTDATLDALTELKDDEHAQVRVKTSELVTDRAGRVNTGGSARSAYGAPTDAHENEEIKVAHDLAADLHQALEQRRFAHLYLMASPVFLGRVRRELSPQVERSIVATLNRDYTHHTVAEIREFARAHHAPQ